MINKPARQSGDRQSSSASSGGEERLANALGWFSVGLGLAKVIAPDKIAQLIGLKDKNISRTLLRTHGFREITSGIGILSQPRPTGWMWGPVAGDLMDLATLGSALSGEGANATRVATATAAVLGVTALDVFCSRQLSRTSPAGAEGTGNVRATRRIRQVAGKKDTGQVKQTLMINRPPDEVYRFWRDFENLPAFMSNLQSVQITSDTRSHWKAKGPAGSTFEWDAEITEDQPNNRIAWRSVGDSDVHNAGSVLFERATGGRGTLLTVNLQYAPPGGAVGATVAKLFGSEPGQEIEDDLRRLKQILETGEVVKSDASIHQGTHAAQPSSTKEAASIWSRAGELVNS